MEPTMHELLVRTRNEIARRGHTRKTVENMAGEVCLYGGFFAASSGSPWKSVWGDGTEETKKMMADFAITLGFEGLTPLVAVGRAVSWSDMPERTKEDVLALLDEAIARTAPDPEDPFPAGVREEVAV